MVRYGRTRFGKVRLGVQLPFRQDIKLRYGRVRFGKMWPGSVR